MANVRVFSKQTDRVKNYAPPPPPSIYAEAYKKILKKYIAIFKDFGEERHCLCKRKQY